MQNQLVIEVLHHGRTTFNRNSSVNKQRLFAGMLFNPFLQQVTDGLELSEDQAFLPHLIMQFEQYFHFS